MAELPRGMMETPDGLYCKLPQDSPIAVRMPHLSMYGTPGETGPDGRDCDDPGYDPRQCASMLGPSRSTRT